MFALIATHVIKPGACEAYTKATFSDAYGSIKNEPDCFQFEVLRDQEKSNVFYLIEVYTDKAAFDYHLTTPHFLEWHGIVKDFFESESVLWCSTVIPENTQWGALKKTMIEKINGKPT